MSARSFFEPSPSKRQGEFHAFPYRPAASEQTCMRQQYLTKLHHFPCSRNIFSGEKNEFFYDLRALGLRGENYIDH